MVYKDNYVIRRGLKTDSDSFCKLHKKVFDSWPSSVSENIFDWKYVYNPFVDKCPLVVVEHDGDLIAARGYFVVKMKYGGKSVLGLQSADSMVHPDHRRRGLFNAMNKFGSDLYSGKPKLYYSFPLYASRQGYLKRGWQEHINKEFVRIEKSASLKGRRLLPLKWLYILYKKITDKANSYFRKTYYKIKYHKRNPIRILSKLYKKGLKKDIDYGCHTQRNEKFYDWRLKDPLNNYATYTAEHKNETVGAVVVSWSKKSDTIIIRDIIPFDANVEIILEILNCISEEEHFGFVKAWVPNIKNIVSAFVLSGYVNTRYIPLYNNKSSNVVFKYDGNKSEKKQRDNECVDGWCVQKIDHDC